MIRQHPVLSAVSIGTFVAAFLIETDLEEYGVTVAIYMPASCGTDLSFEAGLYGFDVVTNKQITNMYCLNSFTGQTFAFS